MQLIPLEVIYATPILVAVIFGWRAREASRGAERTFWTFLSVSNAALFMCEVLVVYWIWFVDEAGPTPISAPFQILHAVAAVSFIMLLVAMSRVHDDPVARRSRLLIDAAMVTLFVGVVLAELYVRPVMGSAGATFGEQLIGLGYPLFGFIMVSGAVAIVAGLKLGRWRPWDKMVVGALAIYVAGFSQWPAWWAAVSSDVNHTFSRGPIDLIQLTGHWVLMLAVIYRVTEPTGWSLRTAPTPVESTVRDATLPVLGIAAVPLLMGMAYLERSMAPEWAATYLIVALAVGVLVAARTGLLSVEHAQLVEHSLLDPVAGVSSSWAFDNALAARVEEALRYDEALALVEIDLDHFSEYNAQFGGFSGDDLLHCVGEILSRVASEDTLVARLEADRFGVLLQGVGRLDATVFARKVLDIIEIEAAGSHGRVTASAGIALLPEDAVDAAGLRQVAAAALHEAKQHGGATAVTG